MLDDEEGWTRKKEGRGGRSDEEEGATRTGRKEKVAKGRIIGLAGPCFNNKLGLTLFHSLLIDLPPIN